MKTISILPLALIASALALSGCDSNTSSHEEIVDIGKSCSSASECNYFCVARKGEQYGQCSIECDNDLDCPSLEYCNENSTGERRCFRYDGSIAITLPRLCESYCIDVDYFCSTDTVTTKDTTTCKKLCWSQPDQELEAFIDCVNAVPLYTSACPASECVLDRI